MRVVAQYVLRNYKGNKYVWIGLYDTKKGKAGRNREFKWTDGSKGRYMPWAPGEPNLGIGNEFCVELYANDFMEWNDGDCERKQPYLCKLTP
ncbi:C-type lectin-like [Sceloporus undulatus]|uniref:C-type lectin-like n=1 Tax=Sceloporus undulatus TaxID=8520 RepID=UPI001C4AC02B|nr:C-type lectin-like [Sceloporus undulatus]